MSLDNYGGNVTSFKVTARVNVVSLFAAFYHSRCFVDTAAPLPRVNVFKFV